MPPAASVHPRDCPGCRRGKPPRRHRRLMPGPTGWQGATPPRDAPPPGARGRQPLHQPHSCRPLHQPRTPTLQAPSHCTNHQHQPPALPAADISPRQPLAPLHQAQEPPAAGPRRRPPRIPPRPRTGANSTVGTPRPTSHRSSPTRDRPTANPHPGCAPRGAPAQQRPTANPSPSAPPPTPHPGRAPDGAPPQQRPTANPSPSAPPATPHPGYAPEGHQRSNAPPPTPHPREGSSARQRQAKPAAPGVDRPAGVLSGRRGGGRFRARCRCVRGR
ncbi:hypothetical protein EDD35_1716 [Amycolatopsis thermoflava]|uniref:Uncharacterized protein n=1 Tax=Amycolatopsis thermoflava TaxID=84480 RepID=A0A3N2GRZ1_9PSEU|nr:hypothetical protein EDD35_1716 [Amycolatopsis thermoflava]